MATLPLFPTDEGWPYPDDDGDTGEFIDLDLVDAMAVGSNSPLYDVLNTDELYAVTHRYGIYGKPLSMKEIAFEMQCSSTDVRDLIGSGLTKLRTALRN